MSKLVESIEKAIELSGLTDGMCISFHHHLRNGDYVLNMVMDAIARMGIKNLTVNASSLQECHFPLAEHIKNGVVTALETNYISPKLGTAISSGILDTPVVFRTHGGRAGDIETGRSKIDVAFLGAPTADPMGNCTGALGKSAFGSMGYAIPDAMYADKTVIITDNLVPYPLTRRSISEVYVDYVVEVESIGDPSGIVSGTTKMPRDPIALMIADLAAKAIAASGLLKEGFSFQTGAGGSSLATAGCLHKIIKENNIRGSYALGGITGYMVDMLNDGSFQAIQDVQCFDLKAVESIRNSPNHVEVSAGAYASPYAKSSSATSLDIVVLGATEIDLDFNVNIHTDSSGRIIGGSGGHSDVAEEAKLTVITAPLSRKRLTTVKDRVTCISTPGSNVDLFVTQAGIAVNPLRRDLEEKLRAARLPVVPIRELKEMSESLNGVAEAPRFTEKEVARVYSRRGEILDRIYQIAPPAGDGR